MILTETHERIAWITLNRPDRRNALGPELVHDLKAAFRQAEADEAVRVVVLRANGQVFCAGADLAHLQQLQRNSLEDNRQDSRQLRELFEQIFRMPKPVIAQVQGPALAGGCGLASVCDFVLAGQQATFGYTEVRIGFIPAIVMVFLVKKLGDQRARAWLLSGKIYSAKEAEAQGLVTQVFSPEELENETRRFAVQLANQNSPEAMARTKKMLAGLNEAALKEALDYAVQQNAEARATADCQAGIAAFLEKRKITW
jgi:methylglutaconyl-CoA hydratase